MTSRSSNKSVARRGRIAIDLGVLADEIVAYTTGATLRRTQAGIDIRGRPFRAYSSRYAMRKMASGRSGGVNLLVGASMLHSVAERRRMARKDRITVHVGPSAAPHEERRMRARGGKQRRSKSSGRRPVSNAHLGWIHQTGAGRVPKREWLGLTTEERRELARRLARLPGALTTRAR